MFDAHVARLTERGVGRGGPGSRSSRASSSALTDPSFDTHLHELLDAAPVADGGHPDGRAVRPGRSTTSPAPAPSRSGALGLLRALGRPEVQRTVGFALAVAARVGAELPATTTPTTR
jgi:hypothetical protein